MVVHKDQAEGRFVPERFMNASYDAIYGQTTSPLADPAFAWVRSTNALAYVRCYNWLGGGVPKNHPEWFSGCRVARAGANGEPAYQWEGLERVLDTLVASGVKPFIVCGGMPDLLAAGPIHRNEGGAAANRPKDYARYQDLITQMVRRLEKTYGAEEVRTWFFEAWSQPDHEGSWEGGRAAPFTGEAPSESVEAFNRLYDHFAAGALAVDDRLHVGGPGLAGDRSFLRKFLEHCARGKNAVSGKPGTPVDFISWHRYGPASDALRWNGELQEMVSKEFPELKSARFVLSESGAGPKEDARANTAAEAARLAALIDGNTRSSHPVYMMFRTGDLIDDHFDGFRPLITRLGENTVPLPAFRLYEMLAKMGNERLKTEAPSGIGVLATEPTAKAQKNATQALVYRYDPSVAAGEGKPVTIRVRFTGLSSTLARMPMRLYRIDPETNAPYEAWLAAGKPRPAPRELGEKLVGVGPFPPTTEDLALQNRGGTAEVEVTLAPNSVALITLAGEPSYSPDLCDRGKRLQRAEQDFALAAEYQLRKDFPRAVDAFRKVAEKYSDTFWREVALAGLVGLYEGARSPAEADAARRELLSLPLDEFTRRALLERLRVDQLRKGDLKVVEEINREIGAIDARLAELRRWPLKRYLGE